MSTVCTNIAITGSSATTACLWPSFTTRPPTASQTVRLIREKIRGEKHPVVKYVVLLIPGNSGTSEKLS